MLRERKTEEQMGYEMVLLEELVPEDHLLRKVKAAVDFSFIHELCKDLYCMDNGRPAVPPEMLFKMLLLGYLYGIPSEVKLAEAVNENIAFKWFLGLKLTEKGPNHATISMNRVRRFRDNNIAEQIFNEILRQCVEKGLVGGKILYTDSTHIKAKANKHRKTYVTVEETPKEYMEELNAQVELDRKALGKKAFEHEENQEREKRRKAQSLTDPDAGQQTREGKPDGFHYSEHRTVDSKNNVIVNVHIEPANINDMTPVPEILNEIDKRLGILPTYMGFDAGYHSAQIAHLLEKKNIQGVIGYRRHTHKQETYGNTDSDTTRNTISIGARKSIRSIGQPPPAKVTDNTSATEKSAKTVQEGMNALAKVREEGWWKDMYGRMHLMILPPLPRPQSAEGCMHGERKPLNVHLQKRRSITACALLVCSASKICVNNAS